MTNDEKSQPEATPPVHPLLVESVHEARSQRVLASLCHGNDDDDELDDDEHDGVPDDADVADSRGHRLAVTAHRLADRLEQLVQSGGDPARLADVPAEPDVVLSDLDTEGIARMGRPQLEATVGQLRAFRPVVDLASLSDDQVREIVRDDLRALRTSS